jgi:site-specific recombinase XerD
LRCTVPFARPFSEELSARSVEGGKGGKDRIVYLSDDARVALEVYLNARPLKAGGVFLVQKGVMKGKPISVRGIQKRIEYYAKRSKVKVSCHQLRHTMATQLLNADPTSPQYRTF